MVFIADGDFEFKKRMRVGCGFFTEITELVVGTGDAFEPDASDGGSEAFFAMGAFVDWKVKAECREFWVGGADF